jgi:hypothetical protein
MHIKILAVPANCCSEIGSIFFDNDLFQKETPKKGENYKARSTEFA